MKNKILFPLLFTSILTLAGCNINPTPVDPVDPEPVDPVDPTPEYEGYFGAHVKGIQTYHNYKVEVVSTYEGSEEEAYVDEFFNINDAIYYNNYYGYNSGLILQKNQGYVNFNQYSDGEIHAEVFYSTNPNVGISKFYDLVIENLFIAEYTQDDVDKELYHCDDTDVLAVASNFTGYIDSSWFVEPEEITIKAYENELVVSVPFLVAILDEHTFLQGDCTLTIKDIGKVANAQAEAYLIAPTRTYTAKTEWTAAEAYLFQRDFVEYVPPFLPNASYAYDFIRNEEHDGVSFRFEDYACGNQIEAYGRLLIGEGFVKADDGLYQLIINDDEAMQTTTYNIQMQFFGPDEIQYGRPVSTWYPNGVLYITYRARIVAYEVTTVAGFNEYMVSNGHDLYIPAMPFGSVCTKIANFRDRTENFNQLYGNYYQFASGTDYFRLYFENATVAKVALESYVSLLKESGFTEESRRAGRLTLSNPLGEWNDNFQSYVDVTDPASLVSEDGTLVSYPGYVQMRIVLYIPDHPKGDTPTPTELVPISMEENAKIVHYEFSDVNYNIITGYDKSKDGGYFYAKFDVLDGYYVKSLSIKDDAGATIARSGDGQRWEIKPSKELTAIVIVVETAKGGNMLSAGTFTGGSIYNLNPQAGAVEEGTRVTFTVKLDPGYEIEKVYLLEDPSYEISKNLIGNNSYFFFMPDHDATIMVKVNDGGSVQPEEPLLTAIRVSGQTTTFQLNSRFNFDGTVTAVYSDGSSKQVFDYVVSTPDMTTTGTKEVTVSYAENGVIKTYTYYIVVQDGSTPDPEEEGTTYSYHQGKTAGYDTYYNFVFNDDGTGYFERTPYSKTVRVNFTYEITGNKVTMTFVSFESGCDNTDFKYRLFYSYIDDSDRTVWVPTTGELNEDGSVLSITLYTGSSYTEVDMTFDRVVK